MRMMLMALMFSGLAAAECGPVRYVVGNYSYDIVGVPDTRQDTWGREGAQYSEQPFTNIPKGKVVRILKIIGDVTARWTTRGGRRAWPGPGYYTGVLGAISVVPRSVKSSHVVWGADDTLVYVQGDIGLSGVVRIPIEVEFDERVENAVLPDGKLWFKFAKYLDETKLDTHGEITFGITYCYEGVE